MSTYSLSGTGVQALSAGVTGAHVSITTLPIDHGQGSANPTNYYQVALLRFGDATGYFEAVPVVGGPQWMAVPSGTTRLGYSCHGAAVISFAEIIGGTPPFGGPGALSSLSDVALASPADTQVLTYQSSSSKWINAAAPTGGGGGGALTQRARISRSSSLALTSGNYTVMTWTSKDVDTDTMVDLVTHNDRITITTAGTYLFAETQRFSASSAGEQDVQLYRTRSAVEVLLAQQNHESTANIAVALSFVDDALTGDYYRIKTWTNTSSPTVNASSTLPCSFTATRVQ